MPEAERRRLPRCPATSKALRRYPSSLTLKDYGDVIRSYQEVCADAVGRFERYVAKYLGGGLLIYFGYPQAHEDDPQRAVRVGLAII